MAEIKKGDVVKTDKWVGVVLDVYTSPDGGMIIKLRSAKNILKGQPHDLIDTARFPKIELGTLADLQDDIAREMADARKYLDELITLVTP